MAQTIDRNLSCINGPDVVNWKYHNGIFPPYSFSPLEPLRWAVPTTWRRYGESDRTLWRNNMAGINNGGTVRRPITTAVVRDLRIYTSTLMSQWGLTSPRPSLLASLYCVSCQVSAALSCTYYSDFSCSDAAGLQKRNSRWYSAVPAQCSSDISRWWTLLLGLCSHHRRTTTSLHFSANCTGWRQESELISSSLSLSTSVSTEQHRRTLSTNLASRQTLKRRLRSASSPSLAVRRMRLSTVGDRAFPVTTACVWNSLPL